MAGETGIKSRGRMRLNVRSRAPRERALLASTRMSAKRRDARIGMSESDSTPPASTTFAPPRAISSCALATAWPEEAQARFNEYAGISLGSCGRRLTSRATFGTSADGTTCPKMTAFTSAPSRLVRSSSSRATNLARSTARTSFNVVPDLQNGVRHPAITATRRPFPPGITFSLGCPRPAARGGHNLRLTRGHRPGVSRSKRIMAPRGGQAGDRSTSETPFSHRTRAAALRAMAAEPVDLLVIGGGITGAGVARDAALRGIRTALVDKGDFGGGTSSHSSRLIHGGLRYLEQRAFRLVFEASRERRVLLTIAPHLVRPLAFLFPAYRGARVPAWQLRAGLWLYDLLAAFRNVRAHRWLGRKAVLRVEAGLRERDLLGAGLYYDAQTDDARLVIATIRSAAQAGALVANYAEASSLLKPDGRVRGATVRDALTGATSTVRALLVVNATGPWLDRVRRFDDPQAEPLLRLTKGTHVVVPRQRIGNAHAVTLTSPIDGRVMFILPWGEQCYIGTTDTDEDVSPDDVRATAADVTYLLRSANACFPQARLAPTDVVATWTGLRPLLAPSRDLSASAVSREHRVVESPTGLISIAGGKLTTYRVMGRDVAARVAARLHALDGRPRASDPPTDRLPLPGGETADLEVLVEAAKARGALESGARHLVRSYGSESAAVLNLVDRDRGLGRPIVAGRPEIWAEVVHAVEREMAMRLVDVLVRRLHLFYEAGGYATGVAPAVAARMAELLGWDAGRVAQELAEYRAAADQARGFLSEMSQPQQESG